MSRGTRLLTLVIPLVLVYLLLIMGVISVPSLLMSEKHAEELLPVIPWWILVTFGSYSLASLGLGLVQFRDCPGAYRELLEEITMAKNDLRGKGVSVD